MQKYNKFKNNVIESNWIMKSLIFFLNYYYISTDELIYKPWTSIRNHRGEGKRRSTENSSTPIGSRTTRNREETYLGIAHQIRNRHCKLSVQNTNTLQSHMRKAQSDRTRQFDIEKHVF